MSRVGKAKIQIPSGVTVETNDSTIHVSGPLGKIDVAINTNTKFVREGDHVSFEMINPDIYKANMGQGTTGANFRNAILGVTKGFSKTLKIEGVGYKAAVRGNKLNLSLGFSHPVDLLIPQGLKVETPSPIEIKITGSSAQIVGQFAAEIRDWKKPEPYNGKGIAYSTEHIIRKVGKTAKGSKK